jgi:catechol 2,3-dioxygenase-like lactoylglutathione lyase family enzyme
LAAGFELADTQELVARQNGFESWPALIEGMHAMTASPSAAAASATIIAAEPQLFVSDIDAACRFYVGKLGFDLAFSYGEPAFYAQVARGGARLNLRRVEGPVYDGGLRAREGDVLAATIALADAKPLFLEYEAAAVDFHQRLRTEPWGARTFIVADPDGNLVAFAG